MLSPDESYDLPLPGSQPPPIPNPSVNRTFTRPAGQVKSLVSATISQGPEEAFLSCVKIKCKTLLDIGIA